MQNSQPVCYSSSTLTDVESRYVQIERELLAIVWSCHKFDQYKYGGDIVHVESDHEPLQAVFKKPIYQSPMRLQRMQLLARHSVQERPTSVHRRLLEQRLQTN